MRDRRALRMRHEAEYIPMFVAYSGYAVERAVRRVLGAGFSARGIGVAEDDAARLLKFFEFGGRQEVQSFVVGYRVLYNLALFEP